MGQPKDQSAHWRTLPLVCLGPLPDRDRGVHHACSAPDRPEHPQVPPVTHTGPKESLLEGADQSLPDQAARGLQYQVDGSPPPAGGSRHDVS